MTHAFWLLFATKFFPIQLSVMAQSHKMHFDFSRIVLQFLDFFETKFLRSFVNVLVIVEEIDHRHKDSYGADGFFNSLQPQG